MKFKCTIFNRFNSRSSKLLHFNKPLSRNTRFGKRATTLASANLVFVFFFLYKVATFNKCLFNKRTCIYSIHADKLPCLFCEFSVIVNTVYHLKIMTESNLVVIWVVGWSYLNGASTKAHFTVVIGNEFYLFVDKRQD